MPKTRGLRATVWHQSTNGQVSDHFTFTSKHPRKISLEHVTSQRAGSTRRLIAADAARMRLRHSKQWQLRSLLTQITPRARSEERRVGKECRYRRSPYH